MNMIDRPMQEVATATMESVLFNVTDAEDAKSIAGLIGLQLVTDDEHDPAGNNGQWHVLLTPQQTTWLRDYGELNFPVWACADAMLVAEVSVTEAWNPDDEEQ
jgi:hypothetical protein